MCGSSCQTTRRVTVATLSAHFLPSPPQRERERQSAHGDRLWRSVPFRHRFLTLARSGRFRGALEQTPEPALLRLLIKLIPLLLKRNEGRAELRSAPQEKADGKKKKSCSPRLLLHPRRMHPASFLRQKNNGARQNALHVNEDLKRPRAHRQTFNIPPSGQRRHLKQVSCKKVRQSVPR